MSCPDYYLLKDGRDFATFARDEIVALGFEPFKVPVWDAHCLLSAYEHLFRMGAKEGEFETDAQSFAYWMQQVSNDVPDDAFLVIFRTLLWVLSERTKVGR